jgi:hypothetical protein
MKSVWLKQLPLLAGIIAAAVKILPYRRVKEWNFTNWKLL